ncbi:hypothetical protein [Nocardia brevicatena]|uniref:hypothetical protein n=1 Tax=Nocardia brevicatena TaxID=37327 RepID=UPI00059316BB|nr:hypothetical protein [Nocardia brevicatena]
MRTGHTRAPEDDCGPRKVLDDFDGNRVATADRSAVAAWADSSAPLPIVRERVYIGGVGRLRLGLRP